MKIATGALQLRIDGDTLSEIHPGDKEKPVGQGAVLGFGHFTGQCAEEKPIVTSDKPKVGLCLIFKHRGEATADYVSAPITQVLAA